MLCSRPIITISTMFSIRIILVTMALFSSVPLSLAAPAAQSSAIAQYNPDEPTAGDTIALFDAEDDMNDDLDAENVLDILKGRAVNCGTTSKPGANCQLSACPATQCTVSTAGNCVWKEKNANKRPSGCSNCKCYKRDE